MTSPGSCLLSDTPRGRCLPGTQLVVGPIDGFVGMACSTRVGHLVLDRHRRRNELEV